MSDLEELRALIREVIRDVLPNGLPITETVNLSTDEELNAFVGRLLDLSPEQRDDIRSGRKRFRLAAPAAARPPASAVASGSAEPSGAGAYGAGAHGAGAHGAGAHGAGAHGAEPHGGVRRIERGAVTEAVVSQAAQAGERLVLGRGAVLTPLARDRARASGVQIDKER
jgi:hypothetical protein